MCEVHGYAKQGAAFGCTRQRGYYPMLATRADTGEVVHARQRTGSASTARGAERFVRETIGRVRRAGTAGAITLRADSGYWSKKIIAACQAHRVRLSLTVRNTAKVRDAIDGIDGTVLDGAEGLAHSPSGVFNANAAWLVLATLAHNLARWSARLGASPTARWSPRRSAAATWPSLDG